MAEKRVAPIDILTGLPLPISPYGEIPYCSAEDQAENWHHHFHPRKTLLAMDRGKDSERGGVFLRHCRVQRVPKWAHDEYHALYLGPPIPEDLQKRFLLGVFAVAGYMPRIAIDVAKSTEEDTKVRLTDWQYKQMASSNSLKGEFVKENVRLRRASKFMMDVIMKHVKQDIQFMDEIEIEEFLITSDNQRRINLGAKILDLVIEHATEPIEKKYHHAYKKHRLINGELNNPKLVVQKVTSPFYIEQLERLDKEVTKAVAA